MSEKLERVEFSTGETSSQVIDLKCLSIKAPKTFTITKTKAKSKSKHEETSSPRLVCPLCC